MARGPSSPATPVPLPKVSFVKVQDDGSTKPAGVHDGQARSYGCASCGFEDVEGQSHCRFADNDFSDFNRPEHYIRHIGMLR
jgi:NuA3 HAT complex component NTO1